MNKNTRITAMAAPECRAEIVLESLMGNVWSPAVAWKDARQIIDVLYEHIPSATWHRMIWLILTKAKEDYQLSPTSQEMFDLAVATIRRELDQLEPSPHSWGVKGKP